MPSAQPRAGYLGPAGTFSEEALLASVVADALEPYPLASIYDTVAALRSGEIAWAIVPIENSLEGSINVTLDLLAGEAGDLEIVGEVLLRVRHSLIAAQTAQGRGQRHAREERHRRHRRGRDRDDALGVGDRGDHRHNLTLSRAYWPKIAR